MAGKDTNVRPRVHKVLKLTRIEYEQLLREQQRRA